MSDRVVWVLGESDDLLEAAFTTLEAAEEWKRRLDERALGGAPHSMWWIEEVPLDPEWGNREADADV